VIDEADADVVGWLRSVLAPSVVTLGPPIASPEGDGAACYLLSLVPEPAARGLSRPPVQAIARYLVTTWAPDPVDAHRRLGDVLVAAAERADIDAEQREPPVAIFSGLGVPPQPAVVLRTCVRWPRPLRRAPLVEEPLGVRFAEVGRLVGSVVTPKGTPVARAEVRIPPARVPVWTGPDGAFEVLGAAVGADAVQVTVTARGHTRVVTVPRPDRDAPLVVPFDPTEE
jgi:hypothetical protein